LWNALSCGFIVGQRDEHGSVIPGTERIVEQSLFGYYFEKLKERFESAFDRWDYEAAKDILQEMEMRGKTREVQQFISFWKPIVEFYASWDLFNHALNPKGIKGISPEHKAFVGKLQNENRSEQSVYLLADLLNNADRRMKEGRFDDAVARFYRIIECVAQMRLGEKHGLDTSALDLEKIHPHLQEKYAAFRNERSVVQLAMMRSFELLRDLGDPLGEDFFADEELRDLLQKRNRSILAHGFTSVDREMCERLYRKTLEFCKKFDSRIEKIREKGKFPSYRDIEVYLEEESLCEPS